MPDRDYYYDINPEREAVTIGIGPPPANFPGWERIVSSVAHAIPGCDYQEGRWSCQHREPQDQAALGPCVCQHCRPPILEHFHYFTVEWDADRVNQRWAEGPPLIDPPDLSDLPPNWVRIQSSVRHEGCEYSADTDLRPYERWSCHHVEPADRAPSSSCGCEHCDGPAPASEWGFDSATMSEHLRRVMEVASSGWANIPYRGPLGLATAPHSTPAGEVSYPHPDCPHPFRLIRCDFCGWENHCGFAPHDSEGPLCPRDGRGDSISWQEPMRPANHPDVPGMEQHLHASGLVCFVPNCHDCLCLDHENNR